MPTFKIFPIQRDLGAVHLAMLCPLLIYFWRLPTWWIASGDSILLPFAARHSPLSYIIDPQIWRAFSPSNLTPMEALLYDLDLSFFGLKARQIYWHNLITGSILEQRTAIRMLIS